MPAFEPALQGLVVSPQANYFLLSLSFLLRNGSKGACLVESVWGLNSNICTTVSGSQRPLLLSPLLVHHCSVSVCQAHTRSRHTAENGLTLLLPQEACRPEGVTASHQIMELLADACAVECGWGRGWKLDPDPV